MALPPEIAKGEVITADPFLNGLRRDIKKNRIINTSGLQFRRTADGTTLSSKLLTESSAPEGKLVTVINNTGRDLQPYWFAGIEKVTGRESMEGNFSDVNYVLREPTDDDLNGRLAMLAEPIKDQAAGKAYIQSDGLLSRVLYDEQVDEDDFRFATIEIGGEGGNAYTLKASESGQILVLDVEDKQDEIPGLRWAVVRFPIGVSSGILDEPHDLTYSGEHAEEAVAEFYTNKDGVEVMYDFREPVEGTQGAKITISRGVAYYDTSDEVFYQFVFNLHFDSSGAAAFLTRELRITIDEPEDCTGAPASIAHADTTGQTADDHHAELHSIASHNDTTATGAELETLTDGSNADALHTHVGIGPHTIASHSDTTATGAELETLTDGSNSDGLHAHAHSAMTGQTANDHHNQQHVLADTTALGADHTIASATVGMVIRALTATTAKFMRLLGIDVDYDNASSGLSATNIQDAIDELDSIGPTLPIQSLFFTGSDPYKEVGGSTYETVGFLIFPGTTTSTPATFKVIASRAGSADTSDIRLFDFENSLEVATINYSAEAEDVYEDSTLLNLPATETIFVVQARKNSGDNTRIHYFKLE